MMEGGWTEYTGAENFRGRADVRRIRVVSHVKEIPRGAFAFYRWLKEIDLTNATKIGERALYNCTGLCKVTLCDVKTIGWHAFGGCSNLTAVELPEGLRTIDREAFNRCTGLKSVAIPSTVTEIGTRAFAICFELGAVTLCEGVRVIGQGAFSHCRELESIVIPSTVTEIRGNAFCHCTKLAAVVLPEGLQTIGQGAFTHCRNLESVLIPSTVSEIRGSAFRYCTKLAAVVLPEGLQTIGHGAFDSCLLERIVIPSPAFVISAEGAGNTFQCQLSRDATIPPRDVRMVVSRHVKYMSPDRMEEAGRTINEILGRHEQWQAQIRKLFAYYELHDATTTLELAIWRAKMYQSGQFDRGDDDGNSQTRARAESSSRRNQCRTDSGAHIILPLVTAYLGQLS